MLSGMRLPSHTRLPVNTFGFKPQLTSLVDMMTILLVFLIKSFSADAQIITTSADLNLPLSTSRKPPRAICTVEITTSAVSIEDRVFASLTDIAGAEELLIPSLYEWMKSERSRCDDAAKAEVMIQSDKDVEFNILKRVMYTCSKAGFTDFSVLVQQEE